MKIYVVTPSLNQLNWLKLCVASVADQAAGCSPVSDVFNKSAHKDPPIIHHHLQDGGSTDGTREFLFEYKSKVEELKSTNDHNRYSFSFDISPDSGMYDAINRGWRHTDDTVDVVAYLNCDEQYLPSALTAVKNYFIRHQDKDIVFADALVVDSNGKLICYRKTLPPTKYHSLVAGNVSFFTCSTFVRREVLLAHDLFFDTKWKDLGDAVWGIQMIRQHVRMGSLHFYTSAFTDTGENMNMGENALREKADLFRSAPGLVRFMKKAIILKFRLRKFLRGGYSQKPFSYEIYTRRNDHVRRIFNVKTPSFVWRSRL